jgi:hypothetical protein
VQPRAEVLPLGPGTYKKFVDVLLFDAVGEWYAEDQGKEVM